MDICFAFGTSDSNADETYKKMQEAVRHMIEKYKDYDQIRYAVLPFGTRPAFVRDFGDPSGNVDDLIEYVTSIPRPRGRPDVVMALDRAEKMFDAASPRPRAKKFLVVFVGSKSGNELEMLKKAAKPLEDKGVKVIAVSVGSDGDSNELIKVVSNKGNLIKAKEIYKEPEKLGNEVMVIVLKGKDFVACNHEYHVLPLFVEALKGNIFVQPFAQHSCIAS